METAGKGNVLLIGQSGVGKTTLIRAILDDDQIKAVEKTESLCIYENDAVPFRLIDTIGFEPKHDRRAVDAIRKWSRDSAKKGLTDTKIDLIWFCVDGTSGRLFEQTIHSVLKSVKMWKGVPIVMVITKSYSVPERENDRKLIQNALFKCKASVDVREIVPVVAQTFVISEDAFAPPDGLEQLIEVTNALLPEGIRASESAVQLHMLQMKRGMAQGLIVSATGAAVAVGAIPFVNLADAAILTPMEIGLFNAIGMIYGMKKDDQLKTFATSLASMGAVTFAAKKILAALSAIPGIGAAAGVLNAVVAGSIVFSLGEVAAFAFEQIWLGKMDMDDRERIAALLEEKFSSGFMQKITEILKGIGDQKDKESILKTILKVFSKKDPPKGDVSI